ncbi:MAG: leucine-rich repeat domain-containing protein [Clostridiales bacterium]|jgi:hypothetical protein|nr:leucine-rich repeat domain-containing protein [Clostridiales bacterium]
MSKHYLKFTVSSDWRLKEFSAGRDACRMKSIFVPEGIVCIGENAMFGVECNKLIMPSTLKVIEGYAFKNASIYEIDFGDCKLERIEHSAFERCMARAELPDTVEYIGDYCDLDLEKEGKIKLPKALKYIGAISIDLDYASEVELHESMITSESNLVHWLHNRALVDDWVTLRVVRDGKELYRFIHNERWRVDTSEGNYIGPQGMLYDHYDNNFKNITHKRCKALMAAYRLIWPIDLPERIEKKYRLYVKNNFSELIKGKEEDIETIRLLNDAGLISAFHLKKLLENAAKNKNVEIVAYLVDQLREIRAKSLEL